jgi:hypothetical protein
MARWRPFLPPHIQNAPLCASVEFHWAPINHKNIVFQHLPAWGALSWKDRIAFATCAMITLSAHGLDYGERASSRSTSGPQFLGSIFLSRQQSDMTGKSFMTLVELNCIERRADALANLPTRQGGVRENGMWPRTATIGSYRQSDRQAFTVYPWEDLGFERYAFIFAPRGGRYAG